jgi:hypothetical protein
MVDADEGTDSSDPCNFGPPVDLDDIWNLRPLGEVFRNFVNWAVSQDGKYLTFTTGGAEPKVQRHETLASPKVRTGLSIRHPVCTPAQKPC